MKTPGQYWVEINRHGVNPIIEADETMFSDGKRLVTHLCKSACGCTIFATHSTLSAG